MTIEELRAELHASIDRAVNDYALRTKAVGRASGLDGALRIEAWREVEPYDYRWPDGKIEPYDPASLYRVTDADGAHYVAVAWTIRSAWGKKDRQRAVIFHATKKDDPPGKWYPWTEFVETDDGRYAAPVPDPRRPRAILSDLESLPVHLDPDDVERSDVLFDAISDGPSLRRVVHERDVEKMIHHGHWVARLRKRL